jgi:hypothetical protein
MIPPTPKTSCFPLMQFPARKRLCADATRNGCAGASSIGCFACELRRSLGRYVVRARPLVGTFSPAASYIARVKTDHSIVCTAKLY